MKAEWIYNRSWVYSSYFPTPTEEDERVSLFFESLSGRGEVFVNGCSAGSFEGGEAYVDITALVEGEDNELTVRFQAPGLSMPADNPMPLVGITGPVWLITGNYVTLERVTSRTVGQSVVVDYDITAHTGGKYTFSYIVSLDGQPVNRKTYGERLPAARVTRSHTISLSGGADAPDPATAKAPCYDVRVSVERGGIGCAQLNLEALLPGKGASRRVVLAHGLVTDEMAKDIAALGAEAVCTGEARCVEGDCLNGMKRLFGARPDHFAGTACIAPEALREEADGELFWPPWTPMWRLRGGARFDVEALTALYGGQVGADSELAARASRYEQADALLRRALHARQNGEVVVVPWNAPWESLCGEGITERGGRRRMAWWALKAAWTPDLAWPELSMHFAAEPYGTFSVPIWAAGERAGRVASVSAAAYRMDGTCVVSMKKGASVEAPAQVGFLEVTAPAAGVLILRCETSDENGEVLSRLDVPVPVKGREAPLAALLADPIRLSGEPGCIVNDTGFAALAPGHSLLPGESAPEGEWLNAVQKAASRPETTTN